ncbi:MAG: hypothetical protein OEZ22_05290 [Spirochaetia bacterium]|nr:hypothetical protein [Spirochaetia bacterium]
MKLLFNISFLVFSIFACANETAPEPPANVKASQGAYSDKIKVEWDAVSGATAYAVSKKKEGESQFNKVYYADYLFYEDFSVLTSINYYYYVTSIKGETESDPSEIVTGFIK